MYRSNPFRSTLNMNVITALGMRQVCTEAIHSVARKRQDWTCESTCEHENAKTRKRENGRNENVDAKTAKTRKRRKRENRENGENAKMRKRRKPENGENDENPKTAKSVPVFWFFSAFSVFWFSRFLVFSFRWPHPSGQVAFFMCLADRQMLYFTIQNWRQDRRGKVSEAAGARWRFCARMCSDYRRIVFLLGEAIQGFGCPVEMLTSEFRGMQAHYSVRLEGDLACSAYWKWRFICDADQSWHSFCVAGAVFGEVGGWLFVAGAACRDIVGDSRSAKCCIFQYKIVSRIGPGRSQASGARWRFYPRIILWLSSNRLSIGGSISRSFGWSLELKDFAAGAVLGEFEGWLYLLRALEMTFHMWRGSIMTFILRGRRSIWWGWRVTWLAPRIGNDLSYVTRIKHELHFAWQAQYLVKLEGDRSCSAHCKWCFKVVAE